MRVGKRLATTRWDLGFWKVTPSIGFVTPYLKWGVTGLATPKGAIGNGGREGHKKMKIHLYLKYFFENFTLGYNYFRFWTFSSNLPKTSWTMVVISCLNKWI